MATRLNDFNRAIRVALGRGEKAAAAELFRLKNTGTVSLADALIQAQPKLSSATGAADPAPASAPPPTTTEQPQIVEGLGVSDYTKAIQMAFRRGENDIATALFDMKNEGVPFQEATTRAQAMLPPVPDSAPAPASAPPPTTTEQIARAS